MTRKRANRKRPASVAEVTIAGIDAAPSIGKTGVHLRWHKYAEYKDLTPDQKSELYEWQTNNPDAVDASRASMRKDNPSPPGRKGKKQKRGDKKTAMSKKSVSKLVAKEVEKALGKTSTTTQPDKEETEFQRYLTSMVEAAVKDGSKKTAAAAAVEAPLPPPSLHSIMKSARNQGRK